MKTRRQEAAQREQELPPSAATRLGRRRRLPMASNKPQKKRKTPSKARKNSASPALASPPAPSPAAAGGADKPPPSASKRPPNFSNLEDCCLCRAYVNVTTNPIVGTDQKMDEFWSKVKAKYDEAYAAEDVPDDDPQVERAAPSLQTRFTKKIQPAVFQWNPYFKTILITLSKCRQASLA